MAKTRLATAWLGGCSGCHMSLLDLDEKLIDLAPLIEMVFGPLVDLKVFPPEVDITLVEGAIINQENIEMLRQIRNNSRLVVALGDCAVTGNVPGMRNPIGREAVTSRAYLELVACQPQIPNEVVAPLVKNVRPLHRECAIDLFVPGCPPDASRIYYVLSELLAGRLPALAEEQRMFG